MSGGAFIVGTGRCGSTLLSQVVASHPSVLGVSEYFTVLGGARSLGWGRLDGAALLQRLMAAPADFAAFMSYAGEIPELLAATNDGSPLLAVPLPQLTQRPETLLAELGEYARGLPPAECWEQHTRVFHWLQQRLEKRVWVERSGGSIEYLDQLVRYWPSAKFVHLARFGPTCALSMSRHPFFRVKLARVLARTPDLPVATCLASELPLDRFGALWSADMLRAERILARLPAEQRLLLTYEDLLSAPEQTLCTLANFLDPAGDHGPWAAEAARLVRTEPRRAAVPPALENACRAGLRVYERMRRAA